VKLCRFSTENTCPDISIVLLSDIHSVLKQSPGMNISNSSDGINGKRESLNNHPSILPDPSLISSPSL
jgi:hypothetical protein